MYPLCRAALRYLVILGAFYDDHGKISASHDREDIRLHTGLFSQWFGTSGCWRE